MDIKNLINFKGLNGEFLPEIDIQAYFNKGVNLKIYQEITDEEVWEDDFEPLDLFNLIYAKIELFYANNTRPFDVIKHLKNLKLSKEKLYILLGYIIKIIEDDFKKLDDGWTINLGETELSQDEIALKILQNELDKLMHELYPITPTEKTNKYDFKEVKKHLNTLQTNKDKIEYLITIKTEYKQSGQHDISIFGSGFFDKCKLEIKKLKELSKLNAETKSTQSQKFKLSKTKGAKIDLIRVLYALYEMRLIVKEDDQVPTKKEFMEAFGELVGRDFSNYDVDISQSLRNQNLAVNLKIFEKMIEVIKNNHHLIKKTK